MYSERGAVGIRHSTGPPLLPACPSFTQASTASAAAPDDPTNPREFPGTGIHFCQTHACKATRSWVLRKHDMSPRTPLDKRGPHHMAKAKGAISTCFGSTEPHKINDFGKWHVFCYIHCCVDKQAFVLPHPQLWSHTSSKVLRRAKRACWGLELHRENRHQQPAPAWCVLAHCNRAIFSWV